MNAPSSPSEKTALDQSAWIGRSVPRPNARRLVEGAAVYIDDLKLPRMLHVYYLRSPFASALIKSIDLSSAKIAKGVVAIYTGKIRNWSEVGGNDAPVTVVNKAEGRSTLKLFLDYFKLKSPDVQADVVIGDNEQGIKTVAGNPNAIGYVSIGTAEYDASLGIPIRLLPVGGVDATVDNVANKTFPLSRPLNFVTAKEPTGLAKQFLEFAQSDAVHDLVREQYFVPVSP